MAASSKTEPDTVGTPEEREARRWIAEIQRAEKWSADYMKRCKRIIRRYRNEYALDATQADPSRRRFALLWSNIQTMGPAVYARPPQAVVSRRYKDADPVGRQASEVLERGLNYGVDQYDLDDRLKLARDDYLLIGRGQLWKRYVPHEPVGPEPHDKAEEIEGEGPQITNQAESAEQPVYAEVCTDHLAYNDWGFTPCRSWDEVWYVYRIAYMTREELVERFGKDPGGKVPLDYVQSNDQTGDSDNQAKEAVKRAAIYEVWDKTTGNVVWVSKSYNVKPLDKRPDWLSLDGFFPCPRPLMATTPQDQYIPVPDYVYYQDQAEEIDELTARIALLADALRMVGMYAGEYGDRLANMFNGRENEMIPVDGWAALQDKGGVKGIVEWLPIEMVVKTLQACVETRRQLLEDVYQITGISDILRGASDPNETATAQGLKAQWGSVRVRDRQKEMARFARDCLRLDAEIIAKKFPVPTLKAMTDVKLLTQAEKQQIQQRQQAYQQVAQQSQQMGMQPPPPPQIPPETQKAMGLPTWEEVDALLKDDALRTFRVDVETDSTIEPNETEEKARRVEFVQAIGQMIGQSTQAVQMAPQLAPLIAESIKFLARGFRVGREMEDVIEKTFDQIAQMKPQPQGPQAPPGPTPEEMQLQEAEIQQRAANDQQKTQLEVGRLQLDAQIAQQDFALERTNQQLKAIALERDPEPQGTA